MMRKPSCLISCSQPGPLGGAFSGRGQARFDKSQTRAGIAVFDLIRRKRHGEAAVLIAFDLIELDGEDLRRLPPVLRLSTFCRPPGLRIRTESR
jgi:hypothetical protein